MHDKHVYLIHCSAVKLSLVHPLYTSSQIFPKNQIKITFTGTSHSEDQKIEEVACFVLYIDVERLD